VRTPGSRRALTVALSLTALLGSACIVLDQLGWTGKSGGFPHAHHIQVEELECIDCHLDYEDGDEPGMPGIGDCMVCHEDENSGDEPRLIPAVAVFFDEEGKLVRSTPRKPFPEEVTFSHLKHVTDEEGCLSCHAAVAESSRVEPGMRMDMTGCVSCHEQNGQPSTCATCHTEIREDVPPWTHDVSWSQFHGKVVRNGSDFTVDDCSICHTESSCTTCHQEQPPISHNNFWRLRGHTMSASMDRASCATCHRQDYCDRCHQSVTPISHRGGWGSPRNSHCYSCHDSGADSGCALCHDGTPSHLMAPPLPPGHNPASDCRQCHVLVPHADNGSNCTACHH